jgi:hypothetical protein
MKKRQTKRNAVMLALLSITVWSCSPTSPGMPERKKLPGDEKYMLIPLPDPADDSATISLVNAYKPIAIPFLTQWSAQQQTGVMIDFRADEEQQILRAEYLVQRQHAFSIPVVFLWDRNSAVRAASFMNMLETYSAVKANRISGSGFNSGFGNCFHP